jgi:hypothetical protein
MTLLALSAAPLIAGYAPPAAAQLVTGLAVATGSTVGPDGALYVTEAFAGRVTRVDPNTGATSTFVSGLPVASPLIGIGGPMDVAFLDGVAYVLVSAVGETWLPEPRIDGIYRVDGPDSFTVVADIGAFSSTHLPDPSIEIQLLNGLQYALETFRGGFVVTDGHHNRVLRATLDGNVSELEAFGNIVPTGLEVHGHTILMAEAGPTPHFPEHGKISTIDMQTGAVTEIASGAPLLVDVELGLGQSLYALSQGVWLDGSPGAPPTGNSGSLVRMNGNGTFTVLVPNLDLPTSFEFIGNSAYVVTLTGTVVAIPNVARPPFGRPR